MKKGAPSALMLLVPLALSAHAYELSPTPEAGLWRIEKRVLIDKEERLQTLQEAQQKLPQDTAAQRRALLDEAAISRSNPAVEMECLTPQQAVELVRLETLQQEVQRDVPECELTVHPVDRSTLNIHGRCQAEHGFDGDMRGHLEIISSYEIRSSFLGRGNVQLDADISEAAAGNPVSIQLQEISRWTQPDCGAVPPRERLSF
ncbi:MULTISPECIES: DUF3617 family protein [Halopseudomonas]|uniref:DUF3617 family protein n=1 Tax=Halopseudomonas bauzanensis TaxID=653930 RepID=A0A4U0YW16_9GAMM|nr:MULTISPECIES: DUF3617 family protein [Halopseudomonas]EZQ20333.1 hypothetical protein CF98_03880 [Halopseudomonas bauzanensis]TKA93293.1 DUF3617 family protein [Halopseudomonas bauzanensis]WGK61243.1 DUF3617 family protein [Halopseudomonas sp. SMJS2]